MQPALARHDELVRAAIESSSGAVVKTTGDGFHAAFAVAADMPELPSRTRGPPDPHALTANGHSLARSGAR